MKAVIKNISFVDNETKMCQIHLEYLLKIILPQNLLAEPLHLRLILAQIECSNHQTMMTWILTILR